MPSAERGTQVENSPLPGGEGGLRPAPSPAGAGRVRGYFRRQAKFLQQSAALICPGARIPNHRARELRRNQADAEDAEGQVVMLLRLILGVQATDPSPVPLRLMKAPAAGHPLPKGEGKNRILFLSP
jgi:hypothetical protein